MGYSVMVLRMKIGFPFLVLFLLLSFRVDHAMSSNDYIDHDCNADITYVDGSEFQTNMESVFKNLADSSATTLFSNATVGLEDTVYGLVQCRGDLGQDACSHCISNSTQQIVGYCPNATDAIIWYENCQLRYSDTYFFGSLDVQPSSGWRWVDDTVEDPDAFKDTLGSLLDNLTSEATGEPSTVMFATGYTQHAPLVWIYGLVQCTGDTSLADCKVCLENTTSQIPTTCSDAHGCEIGVRYDTQLFYNTTEPTPSPPSPPSPPPNASPSPPPHPRNSTHPHSRPTPHSVNATSNTTTPGKQNHSSDTSVAIITVITLALTTTCLLTMPSWL